MIKGTFRIFAVLSAACLLTITTGIQVRAESRTRITGPIHIYISSDITAGDEHSGVEASVSGGHCGYEGVEVLNEPDQWAGGDIPRIRVTLTADEGYYFSGISKDMVRLTGPQNPKYSSASIESGSDKTTARVTIKLEELDTNRGELDVDNVHWNEDSGVGEWADSDRARSYQVKLMRDDNTVGSVNSTTNTSYDFSSQITRKGDYTFAVRVIDHGGNKGDWNESENFYVDSDLARDFSRENRYYDNSGYGGPGNAAYGQWLHDSAGWWFRNSNGSYTTNNWQYINGEWYFFNGSGYMQTGWINWNGKWYYCDARTGAMWHDTTTPDGYRVGSDGARTQWTNSSAANRGPGVSGNGNSQSTGGPGTGSLGQWIQDSAGWWYRNADGSYMRNGWQYINNYWYFFGSNGYMQTGWVAWNGLLYYCDPGTGAMWHDATTPDGYRVNSSGARY